MRVTILRFQVLPDLGLQSLQQKNQTQLPPARPTVATTEEPNTATTQAGPVTTEHLVTTGPTRPARPTVATTEKLQANVTTAQTALLTTDVPVSTRPVATTTTEEIASIQADSDTTDAPTEGTTELINNYS